MFSGEDWCSLFSNPYYLLSTLLGYTWSTSQWLLIIERPGTPNNQFKMDVWWFPTISYVKVGNHPIETTICKIVVWGSRGVSHSLHKTFNQSSQFGFRSKIGAPWQLFLTCSTRATKRFYFGVSLVSSEHTESSTCKGVPNGSLSGLGVFSLAPLLKVHVMLVISVLSGLKEHLELNSQKKTDVSIPTTSLWG